MSFKTNDCQQLSFDDSFMNLTERERKALENSWAKIFADEIFPAIDEERLSVSYSPWQIRRKSFQCHTDQKVRLYSFG